MRRTSDGASISVAREGQRIVVRKFLDGGLVASETMTYSEVRARLATSVVERQAWIVGQRLTVAPPDVEWLAAELRIALDE
jgi:hypothetical protein